MDWMTLAVVAIVAMVLLGGLALTESWELILILLIGAVVITKVL